MSVGPIHEGGWGPKYSQLTLILKYLKKNKKQPGFQNGVVGNLIFLQGTELKMAYLLSKHVVPFFKNLSS